MFTSKLRKFCALLSFTALFCLPEALAWADVFDDQPSDGAREVELFAAIEAEDVDAVMIPRDSRRATLQIKNNTEQPLAIRLPHAFAGVPVLAQQGLGLFGNPGGGGGGAPQALGMGFPGGGQGLNGLLGGPGGVMNVPPGKVLKVKRKSVCLQYGNPEPGPRVAYKIVPLKTVSSDESLSEMLAVLGYDGLDQRVAQIAAWHFANGMSWEQLAGLTVRHFNGSRSPRFSAAEIRAAQQLAGLLPSQQERQRDEDYDRLSRR